MYCIKCGVKLGDTEKKCPLCNTVPYHPDIEREETAPLYPQISRPEHKISVSMRAFQAILIPLFLAPAIITLVYDLHMNKAVTWSGFVIGAIIMTYSIAILPMWFKKPNPVIFVPCSVAAIALYLLYVDAVIDGRWFLSFAFPAIGGIGIIITTTVTLCRYVKRGRLYIFGGTAFAFGIFLPIVEFLLNKTFSLTNVYWSIAPAILSIIVGATLIFLGICRPARETMKRKFFF